MNSFSDIAKYAELDVCPDKGFLSHKRINEYFQEILNIGFPEFVRKMGNSLNENEKAILTFLHFVHQDSYKTIKLYSRNICYFLVYANCNFYEISSHHVKSFVEHQKKNEHSIATINNQLATLKSFFGHLNDISLIQGNPAKPIKLLKGNQNKFTEKVLNEDEVNKLIAYTKDNADIRDYLIVRFLYATGVRVAEMVNVRWGDLFKDVQNRNFVKITGKGGKHRNVYVPQKLHEDLMIYRAYQYQIGPHEKAPGLQSLPMFPNRRKLTQSLTTYSVYRIIKSLGEGAGLESKISPHWLRHTFATHARLKHATLESIKSQLGHEKFDTTLQYEHSAHLSSPAGAVFDNSLDTEE